MVLGHLMIARPYARLILLIIMSIERVSRCKPRCLLRRVFCTPYILRVLAQEGSPSVRAQLAGGHGFAPIAVGAVTIS